MGKVVVKLASGTAQTMLKLSLPLLILIISLSLCKLSSFDPEVGRSPHRM
jgi:hypothetical protein